MPLPKKDQQTVTPDGKSTKPRIAGLGVRRLLIHEDERGDLTELYNPAWGFHPDPMVYLYTASVRPGQTKGWVKHQKQDDRIITLMGTLTWAFYDDREGSPSRGLLNVITCSDRARTLFTIPLGVWHAVKNVGYVEALFLNLPTRAYDHTDPDKLRLPLTNDLIPFDFSKPSTGGGD